MTTENSTPNTEIEAPVERRDEIEAAFEKLEAEATGTPAVKETAPKPPAESSEPKDEKPAEKAVESTTELRTGCENTRLLSCRSPLFSTAR